MNNKPVEKPFSFLLFIKRITKDNPNMVMLFTINYLSHCFIFLICSKAFSEILHLANVK